MSEPDPIAPLPRVHTGIPGLDTLLFGGLLRGGLYIVLGTPGAGKTILANQICFHHTTMGGTVTYVTLLAETHARMLAHMQTLAFFDVTPITHTLSYLSGYRALKEDGLRGLLAFLRGVVREQRASMLVIDGFITAEQFASTEVNYKQFIHELHAFLEAVDCTALLLSQEFQDGEISAPHTMVDGIIELRDTLVGLQAVRHILVRKFRGSPSLRGLHHFTITDAGITIYPRTEVQATRTPQSIDVQHRKAFGIAQLDSLLGGGVAARSTTMLLGLPGSGKTILSLHFLSAGLAVGEPGLLLSFNETPEDLTTLAADLDLPIAQPTSQTSLIFQWQLAAEQHLDALAAHVLATVAEHKIRRLVIDSLGSLQSSAVGRERLGPFLAALTNELRRHDVTSLITVETPRLHDAVADSSQLGLSALVDNIVFLQYHEEQQRLRRDLVCLKVRRHASEMVRRTFTITNAGIIVDAPDGEPAQLP